MRKKALRAQLDRALNCADAWELLARDEAARSSKYAARLQTALQHNARRSQDVRELLNALNPQPIPNAPERVHEGWLHLDIDGLGMCYCIPEALLFNTIRKLKKWAS